MTYHDSIDNMVPVFYLWCRLDGHEPGHYLQCRQVGNRRAEYEIDMPYIFASLATILFVVEGANSTIFN